MNSTEKRQADQIGEMSTLALRRILHHFGRTAKTPRTLSGQPIGPWVHVSGIGQVSIGVLRAELDRRERGIT